MPQFVGDICRVYDNAGVRVDGIRISGSARIVENGVNATIYSNDINVVYYLLRNMKRNTGHRVEGAMSINAYNSQTSNRAMYSIRVSPWKIIPVEIDSCTLVSVKDAVEVSLDMPVPKKKQFVVKLYIFQNWDRFITVNGNKLEFAAGIMKEFEELCAEGSIKNRPVPVIYEEVNVQVLRNRRLGAALTETEAKLNAAFGKVELCNPKFSETFYMDDSKGFDKEHFVDREENVVVPLLRNENSFMETG
ncbi:MAG: hypothetical protein EXX96DRAFT_591768 [Benjaminiella poitrasii]|nr:MAG: hypothetical protein EXX96DRAFT_591768 [Benjaminiella poitrasii]